eukprot:4763305-Alexandrium_andersonii.AAC.1
MSLAHAKEVPVKAMLQATPYIPMEAPAKAMPTPGLEPAAEVSEVDQDVTRWPTSKRTTRRSGCSRRGMDRTGSSRMRRRPWLPSHP